MEFLFNQEINLYGIRRSGIHAVANWIACQFDECYLSNDSAMGFNQSHFSYYRNGLRERKDQRFTPTGKVFLNIIENVHLGNFEHKWIKWENKKAKVARMFDADFFSREQKIAVVLRDPFNQLASILKSKLAFISLTRFPNLWENYAGEIVHRRTTEFFDLHYVNYNKWFSDRKFRKSIAKNLGMSFNDRGLNDVTSQGNGSSFDGRTFDGSAQNMHVLERWRAYIGHPKFELLRRKGGLLELSKALFPLETTQAMKAMKWRSR